jgi:hypothetical protein
VPGHAHAFRVKTKRPVSCTVMAWIMIRPPMTKPAAEAARTREIELGGGHRLKGGRDAARNKRPAARLI